MSSEDAPLSADAQRLLRELSWFEPPDLPDYVGNELSRGVKEIPIVQLARGARLSVERATAAARELAQRREGISIDGHNLVVRH